VNQIRRSKSLSPGTVAGKPSSFTTLVIRLSRSSRITISSMVEDLLLGSISATLSVDGAVDGLDNPRTPRLGRGDTVEEAIGALGW